MKPMLAVALEDINLKILRFPLFGSIKMDGIRCLITPEGAMTRSLKPIRNQYIQDKLKGCPVGLDGELLLLDGKCPMEPGMHPFNKVSSAVMNGKGCPDFQYWVFDHYNLTKAGYIDRLNWLVNFYGTGSAGRTESRVMLTEQVELNSLNAVLEYEKNVLDDGYEGIILRGFDSPYKNGRSTLKEQFLLKRKPFDDDEAIVIGFVEQLENTNEAFEDELGHSKRSTAKEGLIGKNTLGRFLVRSDRWGEFAIGCGRMTHAEAQHIWDNKHKFMGELVTFKYQKIGTKDKPRTPIFKGFRSREDI